MNRLLPSKRVTQNDEPSTHDRSSSTSCSERSLAEERAQWESEEWARRKQAHQFEQAYVPQEMPLRLQDDAYRAQRASEIEEARIEHERHEGRKRLDLGDAHVPTDFDPATGWRPADEDQPPTPPPPPPPKEKSNIAEILGAQAYGAQSLNINTSYCPGVQNVPSVQYDAAGDVYGGALERCARPAASAPLKHGWAGIFDRHPGAPGPPPNPFVGPIVYPQLEAPVTTESHGNGKSIPHDVMQRINEGRGLATLALNNHESAPVLLAQGRAREANEAYKAADAGYHRALEFLMPARRMLDDGSESSRVTRVREKDRLEKLITQILDKWENVKANVIDLPDLPDAPCDNPRGGDGDGGYEIQVSDPLLDRLTSSVSRIGIKSADTAQTQNLQVTPNSRNALCSDTGELDGDTLPTPSQEGLPPPGFDSPTTWGVEKCFCGKLAEVMTPCDHFMCHDCGRGVLSLFGECPTCSRPCTESELKGIA